MTTVLCLGVAAVLMLFALNAPESVAVAVIGWTLVACGMLPLLFTRGRHLSWIVFFAAGALCLLSTVPQ